jgi:inner membrane protein
MDSLSQIALGSAVAIGVMGRRTAAWKAAAWGAVAGTLPDLDVVIDHGDALLNMVLHRAESHSLIYLTLFAPLLAWVAARLDSPAQELRHPTAASSGRAPSESNDPRSKASWVRWTLALWLVLVTHPLLDAMTIYGTQLLLPLTNHPFGVGSMFIIDPAYTVPLIVGVVAALRMNKTGRGLRWNAWGLLLSTAYLAWSALAQNYVEHRARASLREQGIAAERVLVTPAPLQTLLWRVVALPDDPTDPHFREAYVSLFDAAGPVRFASHLRGIELMAQHGQAAPVARLSAFSQGFVKLSTTPEGQLRITDLRMGQEPHYVFNFDLGPVDAVGSVPASQTSERPPTAALRWIGQRMWGDQQPPPWAAKP